MKYRDKDGNVFEDLRKAFSDYCYRQGCPHLCPVGRAVMGSSETCDAWLDSHPAEAARLVGYEVVEEKGGTGHGAVE